MLVVADQARDVGPGRRILQDPDPVRTAVDHIADDIQVIIIGGLYFFKHPCVQFILSVNVAANVGAHNTPFPCRETGGLPCDSHRQGATEG